MQCIRELSDNLHQFCSKAEYQFSMFMYDACWWVYSIIQQCSRSSPQVVQGTNDIIWWCICLYWALFVRYTDQHPVISAFEIMKITTSAWWICTEPVSLLQWLIGIGLAPVTLYMYFNDADLLPHGQWDTLLQYFFIEAYWFSVNGDRSLLKAIHSTCLSSAGLFLVTYSWG